MEKKLINNLLFICIFYSCSFNKTNNCHPIQNEFIKVDKTNVDELKTNYGNKYSDTISLYKINFDSSFRITTNCYDIKGNLIREQFKIINVIDTCYILRRDKFGNYQLATINGTFFNLNGLNENQISPLIEFKPPKISRDICEVLLPNYNELFDFGIINIGRNINELIFEIVNQKDLEKLVLFLDVFSDIQSASAADIFSENLFSILMFFSDDELTYTFNNLKRNILSDIKEQLFIVGYGLNTKANILYFQTYYPNTFKHIMLN